MAEAENERAEGGGGSPLQRVHLGLWSRLKAYFLAGVLITAPVGITVYLAWLFVSFVDARVTPLIPPRFNPETYLPFALPGLGLVVVVVVLTLIGMLTAGFLGRLLTSIYDGLLSRMPVIRGLYAAVKQLFETALAQRSQAFRQAVLVEFPRPGLWGVGFVTGAPRGELAVLGDDEMVTVFLPTTPNPTTGFLLFLPRRDVIPLKMTVEDAVKLIMSVGIVMPAPAQPAAGAPPFSRSGSGGPPGPVRTDREAS